MGDPVIALAVWGLRMGWAVAAIYLVAARHTFQSQTHRQII